MKLFEYILNKKYGELFYGLLSGTSSFIIILKFILLNTNKGGGLLAFFFAPMIICGIALVSVKLIRSWKTAEKYKNIELFIFFDFVISLISIIILVDMLLYGIA